MRITGGKHKGRKLYVPDGQHVRPTSDRMRQTIFNLLNHAKWADDFELSGARVMDLYCGTGALGLEAISQGASHCTFIDRDIAAIKKNAHFMDAQNFTIKKANLPKTGLEGKKFDLVFMDPPYFKDLIGPTIDSLLGSKSLSDQAIIVIEAEKNLKLSLPLTLLDQRTQSQSNLYIFGYKPAVNKEEE